MTGNSPGYLPVEGWGEASDNPLPFEERQPCLSWRSRPGKLWYTEGLFLRLSDKEWRWDWPPFHLVLSRCWIDLVPDLTGLVKDAWLVTDFGFPLLSAVEYQMTSLGLARGIKNDRCKGTQWGHVWHWAHQTCTSSGPAENTGCFTGLSHSFYGLTANLDPWEEGRWERLAMLLLLWREDQS